MDDNGKEVQFEFLDFINYEDEGYVVLYIKVSKGKVKTVSLPVVFAI